jgi:hypothetical protein
LVFVEYAQGQSLNSLAVVPDSVNSIPVLSAIEPITEP